MSVSQVLYGTPAGLSVNLDASVTTSDIAAPLAAPVAPQVVAQSNLNVSANRIILQPQGGAVEVAINPGRVQQGGDSATLTLAPGTNAFPAAYWDLYAVGSQSGGGLNASQFQLFGYGTNNSVKQYIQCQDPNDGVTTQGITLLNYGLLDTTRSGIITGTGANQTVAVDNIRATSDVWLFPLSAVAGPPPNNFPVAPIPTVGAGITITPSALNPFAAGSFDVTLPAGYEYRYLVVN